MKMFDLLRMMRLVNPEEKSLYGYCPTCGAPGVTRERRPDGNDTCKNGHIYRAKDAITKTKTGHEPRAEEV